jgi:hypothetical protein
MTKGYPRSRFEIIDQTNIQELPQTTIGYPVPMAMAAYTSDKGPEQWRVLSGLTEFSRDVGSISFTKHGQGQLTVAEILRNGGVVFGKRMVSEDATLANVTIRARVINSDNVSYLYFYTKSYEDVATFDEATELGYDNFDANTESDVVDVPLFTVTPMGRGVSNMAFRINPEYVNSKSSSYVLYSFEVYENQELLESITFTMNPDVTIDGVSQAMNPKIHANSNQVKVNLFDDGFYALITALAKTATDSSGNALSVASVINMDFINAVDRRGKNPMGGVVTSADADSDGEDLWTTNTPSEIADDIVDICDALGVALTNGSYGASGNSPIQVPGEYEKMLLGTYGANQDSALFDTVIYDLDANKIDFVVDANYPLSVKKAINDLADFRQDFAFLADMNTDVHDVTTIVDKAAEMPKSRFIAVYHNHFKIYDPYTNKQIRVTMPFLLASRMVQHISDGVGRPFAGMLNSITFPEIIDGSVNFLPVVIPGVDQKQALVDANVNYLSYYDGTPVMETMYTNPEEEYTQLSYLHNIMAIQEVIKAVRTECPKVRYTFMDGSDLENYISDANAVINKYVTNFKSISMQYMADEKYESNSIFYATITVQFKNFVQEEYFRVIAIS